MSRTRHEDGTGASPTGDARVIPLNRASPRVVEASAVASAPPAPPSPVAPPADELPAVAPSAIRSGSDRHGRALMRGVLPPLAAAAVVANLDRYSGTSFEAALVTFIVFAAVSQLLGHETRHAALLPFFGRLVQTFPAVLGTAVLVAVQLLFGLPDLRPLGFLEVAVAVLLPIFLLPWRSDRGVRAAVIGSVTSADMLARELVVAGERRYVLVGTVTSEGPHSDSDGLPVLGPLSDLRSIVEDHRVDLLLMTGEAPRLAVFEELANSCLHLPVRLWELSAFYEDLFGHVPMAEINASWFQYIMHPKYEAAGGAPKRALDLTFAVPLSLLVAPLVGLLALLIRRDGGPSLFSQKRIGEGGRPFTVYKLRTMRQGSGEAAQWASADDPRITPLGRFLRRSHLDELPQLINVLRGDMTLVGPRPEQPEFVERLEGAIPFYTRRHLIKPGVTGWAQVRCGYSGSDFGSAWKLCHDLYYLKHRSFWLDIAIIVETARTLVADRQYDVEPAGVSFILRPAITSEGDQAAIAAL